jgi:pimeloyl-ACP methyl ester carboxylesterase
MRKPYPLALIARTMVSILLACSVLCVHARASQLTYGWQLVDGINLFYREGGPSDAPTLVFLHGNPSSSIMYEKVMEQLVATCHLHVIAMDYPSFGYSDAPDRSTYSYTFENLAKTVSQFLAARNIKRYGLYMQDYGVPVGFRLIVNTPSAITFLIVQNGVIHLDGFPAAQDKDGELRRHWRQRNLELDKRRAKNRAALPYVNAVSYAEEHDGANPEAMLVMVESSKRPGVSEARDDLWFNYGSNVERYPIWQDTLKRLKVPLLVVWGSHDDFFTTPGALAYLRDAPQAEIHIIDSTHFATLDQPETVAGLVAQYLDRNGAAIGFRSADGQ